MINITKQPDKWYQGLETFERGLINLPIGVPSLCPNCSSSRTKSFRKDFMVMNNPGKSPGFNCTHCGIGGIIVGQKSSDRPTIEKKPYIPIPLKSGLSPHVVEYFKGRGISEKTLIWAKVSENKGGIAFVYHANHAQVGIKYRDLAEGKKKKMWSEVGSQQVFYGIDDILAENGELRSKELIITEGEIDRLSIIEAGSYCVVSVPSGANRRDNQGTGLSSALDQAADILKKFETYLLCVDDDESGQKLQQALMFRLGKHKCKTVTYPHGFKDANDVLKNAGPSLLKAMLSEAELVPMEGVKSFGSEYTLAAKIFHQGFPDVPGLGFSYKFDSMLKFIPGQLTLFTGVFNHGKSAFVFFLAAYLAIRRGWVFGIYSPEQKAPVSIGGVRMPEHIFTLQPLLEILVGKPMMNDVINVVYDANGTIVGNETIKKMSRKEFDLAHKFVDRHFKLIDPGLGDNKIDSLLEKSDYLRLKYGVDSLIFDPWNKIQGVLGLNNKELGDVLNKVIGFLKSRDMTGFISAHPIKLGYSDQVDSKGKVVKVVNEPGPYDIKGGGEFGDMADNIVIVYRDFIENETRIRTGKVKHRILGSPGKVARLRFNTANSRFYDVGSSANYEPLITLGELEEKLELPF